MRSINFDRFNHAADHGMLFGAYGAVNACHERNPLANHY
jgi:hypothetical protein